MLRHRWSKQKSLIWEFRLYVVPEGCPLIEYKESSSFVSFPGANWVLSNLEIQLWSNCPALIWKLEGAGWFNPTDVENSSKEGRGYTKTNLNSSTCLEVARPRKSIPTLCPRKRRNSLGSVNSKVGTWAQPVIYSSKRLNPTAQGWPPCLRNLATVVMLIEDALKLFSGGKLFLPATKWNNS